MHVDTAGHQPASTAPRPRRRRRRTGPTVRAGVAVLAALALASACSGGSDPADRSAGPTTSVAPSTSTSTSTSNPSGAVDPTTAPPADPGAYPVGQRTLDLEDTSRPTAANGDAPGSPGRRLPTLVMYPTPGAPRLGPDGLVEPTADAPLRTGRYPLVVFSHGVTGVGVAYQKALRTLASAGYIVLAPDYPLSSTNAPGGPTINDVRNQPGDVSYLLDVFTATDGPGAEVAAHVDGDRIGLAGHSLGAITSLGAGYGDCCVDDRVQAVVAWAGMLIMRPAADATFPDRPLLLVHGTDDGTVPYSSSQDAFDTVDAPRWFLTLPGSGHNDAYFGPIEGEPATRLVTVATIDFFDAFLKHDPKGVDRIATAVDRAGPTVATLQAAGD